ncbi:TetR/AcrR family transcriptional regulator [Kocuria arenosa]|uniref:TetR/AcrR family transcriptional regulator n=1 Tax=Kocuria arenosa TaxID=3071446 RepID=UPI0034D676D0
MDAYHHGDLRRAVLDRALEVVAQDGPAALNLRAIAGDIGVSHTAPRYHFSGRRGVLTAIAAEGFEKLRDRLSQLRQERAPFLELGVAYVEFALEHRAHFAVMFDPSLVDTDDPAFVEASDGAFAELRIGVDTLSAPDAQEDAAAAVIAAWSLVHGLATLALTGNLDRARIRDLVAGGDLSSITRRAAGMLYGSPARNDGV